MRRGVILFFLRRNRLTPHSIFSFMEEDPTCGVGKRRRETPYAYYVRTPTVRRRTAVRISLRAKTRVGGDEGGFLPSPAAAAVPPDAFFGMKMIPFVCENGGGGRGSRQ